MNASESNTRSQDIVYEITRHYVSGARGYLSQAMSDRVLGLLRARDYAALANLFSSTLSAQEVFRNSMEARIVRQISAFFQKNECFTDPERSKNAAIRSFKENEDICSATNARFSRFNVSGIHASQDPLTACIVRMRHFIKNVLDGRAGTLDRFRGFLEKIPDYASVTSGATASLPRSRSLPQLKLDSGIEVTSIMASMPSLFGLLYPGQTLCTNDTERVLSVPKNWKTERTIAAGITGAVPYQLAFDSYAKGRLRSFGCDLRDQTLNQELSRLGSVDGSYATIDLKAASDCVSFEVVRLLLPPHWFNYLRAIRGTSYSFDGVDSKPYQKFAAMGNGSTFTIETLIFASAAYAVSSWNTRACRRWVVYGDDIVIERQYASAVCELLSFLGFSTNDDKSFLSGPFRESCGMDWWEGVCITPFYLRRINFAPDELCHLLNGLRSIGWWCKELAQYIDSIQEQFHLLTVPYNEDTRSGIFDLDARCVYRRGIAYFKAYTRKAPTVDVGMLEGSYRLWLLRSRATPHRLDPCITSTGTVAGRTGQCRIRRRNFVTAVAPPLWLYAAQGERAEPLVPSSRTAVKPRSTTEIGST